ncbi:CAP domain-containing protein [Lactobacillaceae bacterium Scapto_B20]
MKSKSLLVTGAIVAALFGSYQTIANAKVKTTTTYQAKTKKVTLYHSLPKSKNVKANTSYRLSGRFSAKSIESAKGQKYVLLQKDSKSIGWFKLSDLKKITTKTGTDAKKSTNSDDDSNRSNSNNSDNDTNQSSSQTTSQTSSTNNVNPDAPIANMDYSYSASNNPSSIILNLMNQTNVNWDDVNVQAAAAQAAFNAINAARASAGIPALTINDELTKIAQSRVQQITTNLTHYDSNHQMIAVDNANSMGLGTSSRSTSLTENLGKSFYLDSDSPEDAGNRIIASFQAEGPAANDGKEHGHYEADMDPTNKEVGVSFYHVPNTNDTYLAAEFGDYVK